MLKSWQESLIFYPEALPQEHTFTFAAPFDEVFLERPDGARLHALHFQAGVPKAGGPAEGTAPRGTIVYFHGNAGSLASWGEVGAQLSGFGYDVVIPDFRTFGKSTGALSEKALHHDAVAWWKWADEHGASGKRIIFGRSIGSGLAVPLAKEARPDHLILETPFLSLEAMAKVLFPGLPLAPLMAYRFRSDLAAPHVVGEVTILHGDADEVVPHDSGKALFETFDRADPKRFVTVEGGHHNDLSAFEDYRAALAAALGAIP